VQPTRRLPIGDLAPYLLEGPGTPLLLRWLEVFDNDQPVEIEVGSGKGLFLITAAAARPGVNFLGIEIARKYQLFAANRVAKRKLTNVRVARADARQFLRDCVPSSSCQAIHVYFPDPWWKRRHQKRRVLTVQFCTDCARVLTPGGRLRIATDVEEYFSFACNLLSQCDRLRAIRTTEPASPRYGLDYLSNFERKFRQAGRTIYRLEFERAITS